MAFISMNRSPNISKQRITCSLPKFLDLPSTALSGQVFNVRDLVLIQKKLKANDDPAFSKTLGKLEILLVGNMASLYLVLLFIVLESP